MKDPDVPVDSQKFSDAMDVLSYWRFSHETPLAEAARILEGASLENDRKAIFARRLKRAVSIFRKLHRYENMSLKTMQDIGGCRAVLTNEKKLRQTVRTLKKRSEFRDGEGRFKYKDYIDNPKEDGYRSYHLVGKFRDAEGSTKNIELQLRTRIQHYWATALEIVDLFTGQALKSNQGRPDWSEFFLEVSRQFSVMDSIHLFESLDEDTKFKKYWEKINSNPNCMKSWNKVNELTGTLYVMRNLEAFAGSIKIVDEQLDELSDRGYVLLQIDTIKSEVTSQFFPSDDMEEAERYYIKAEKEAAKSNKLVVALVSSSAVGGIKQAYPNYFADSTEFMKYLVLINSRP